MYSSAFASNSRDVEALAGAQAEARGKTSKRRPRGSKSADVRALERRLSEILGLQVEINHRASGGDLRIRYKTLEQLDAVCRKLGVRH
jgi:ParB family chromosome partitioning protein